MPSAKGASTDVAHTALLGTRIRNPSLAGSVTFTGCLPAIMRWKASGGTAALRGGFLSLAERPAGGGRSFADMARPRPEHACAPPPRPADPALRFLGALGGREPGRPLLRVRREFRVVARALSEGLRAWEPRQHPPGGDGAVPTRGGESRSGRGRLPGQRHRRDSAAGNLLGQLTVLPLSAG